MKDEEIDDSNLPDWVITTALPSGNSQARSVAVSCFTTAVLVRSKSASRSMVDSFRFIVFDQPPFWLGNKEDGLCQGPKTSIDPETARVEAA